MAKKLLTAQQITEIKDALEDVTYTFFDTDVHYFRIVESLDRWQEDRGDTDFNEIMLKGFLEEDPSKRDKIKKMIPGATDFYDVMVLFNTRDLDKLGLLVHDQDGSFRAVFKVADEHFTISGVKYRIEKVYLDGRFDKQPILAIVLASAVKN